MEGIVTLKSISSLILNRTMSLDRMLDKMLEGRWFCWTGETLQKKKSRILIFLVLDRFGGRVSTSNVSSPQTLSIKPNFDTQCSRKVFKMKRTEISDFDLPASASSAFCGMCFSFILINKTSKIEKLLKRQ